MGSDVGKVVSEDGCVVGGWDVATSAHGVHMRESLCARLRLLCQPVADAYLHVAQQRELPLPKGREQRNLISDQLRRVVIASDG